MRTRRRKKTRKPVPPLPTSTGDVITNIDLVLFALYEVGGAKKYVNTEDVAAKAFGYPVGRQRYRWERYDYPDKARVARELYRLKRAKETPFVKGHLNIGSKKDRLDGWMLTASGVDRIKAIENHAASIVGKATGTHSKYEEDALRRRITTTPCYKIYLKDPVMREARDYVFTDMLYCLPDTPNDKVCDAYDHLLASAKAVSARDIIEFLEAARRRFKSFFGK